MLVERKKEIDELKELLGDEYTDYNLVFASTSGTPKVRSAEAEGTAGGKGAAVLQPELCGVGVLYAAGGAAREAAEQCGQPGGMEGKADTGSAG